jgi:hypothetical protein
MLGGFAATACQSASLCLGVDYSGDVFSSTEPAAGYSTWNKTATAAVASNGLTALACPSSSLCVAADYSGNFYASTEPTGASSAWSEANAPAGDNSVFGITCPSTSLCVAHNDSYSPTSGQTSTILTSTNPASPSRWQANGPTISEGGIMQLACPTTTACVGFDGIGDVFSSSDPAGGAGSWSAPSNISGLGDVGLGGLACPSASLCVGYSYAGAVVSSTDPTGGPSAWSVSTPLVSGATYLTSISCPTAGLCLIGASNGEVWESTDPSGGSSYWSEVSVDPGQSVDSLACSPDAGLCALADGAGNMAIGVPAVQTNTTTTTTPTTTTPTTTTPTTTTPTTTTPTTTTAATPPAAGGGRVRAIHVRGLTLLDTLGCVGASAQGCSFTETLQVVETISGGKLTGVAARAKKKVKRPTRVRRLLTLGVVRVKLRGGQSKAVRLTLNGPGRVLLSRRGTLPVRFTVKQGVRTVHSQTVVFRKPRKSKKRTRHAVS